MSINTFAKLTNKSISVFNIGKSHYGTWALAGFSQVNAGRAQPVLEVDKVIRRQAEYVKSIELRKSIHKPNISQLPQLYEAAKQFREERKEAEKRRDDNTAQVQKLLQKVKDTELEPDEVKVLRVNGKKIRNELKKIVINFNEANDQLVDLILSLPNLLDPATPTQTHKVLKNVVPPPGVTPFKRPTHINWDHVPGVGPYNEFPYGEAAWAELDLAAKCQKRLLDAKFSETGNVDFVKRVLLDGAGIDPGSILRVRGDKIKGNGIALATYLVGGASFPAFLALFAQSILQNEDVLPIKYFVVGRTYKKRPGGEGTIQSSAVQVFVACRDGKEQEAEFAKMIELMESFYANTLGVTFQSRLLAAPELQKYEEKKIAFVEKDTEKLIGDLSTAGDYVSKRLLCCYADTKRSPKFLNMVTGQFLDITNFLRPSEGTAGKTDSSTHPATPADSGDTLQV